MCFEIDAPRNAFLMKDANLFFVCKYFSVREGPELSSRTDSDHLPILTSFMRFPLAKTVFLLKYYLPAVPFQIDGEPSLFTKQESGKCCSPRRSATSILSALELTLDVSSRRLLISTSIATKTILWVLSVVISFT